MSLSFLRSSPSQISAPTKGPFCCTISSCWFSGVGLLSSSPSLPKRGSRAAKRGDFKRGGCPGLDSSFLPFLSFLGLSRFSRISDFFRGFPIGPFSLSQAIKAPTRNSPERVRGTIGTFPEKSGKPPGLGTPGLASVKRAISRCDSCDAERIRFARPRSKWPKWTVSRRNSCDAESPAELLQRNWPQSTPRETRILSFCNCSFPQSRKQGKSPKHRDFCYAGKSLSPWEVTRNSEKDPRKYPGTEAPRFQKQQEK